MGEAKVRKQSDKFYGKEAKAGRGIILPPPIEVFSNGIEFARVDREVLRRAALFWDRISIPENNIFDAPYIDPDIEYLKACGLAEVNRTILRISPPLGRSVRTSAKSVFLTGQLEVFKRRNLEEPGLWTMEHVNDDFNNPQHDDDFSLHHNNNYFSKGRGTLIKLSRAIPMPIGDTPLEEILNFKERRRDEIKEMMIEISRMYERIISSVDSEHSFVNTLDEIEMKCASMLRVAAESNIKFKIGDFGFNFSPSLGSIASAAPFAALGRTLGAGHGFDGLGALLGGMASFISINAGIGLQKKCKAEGPFRVVAKMHEEIVTF